MWTVRRICLSIVFVASISGLTITLLQIHEDMWNHKVAATHRMNSKSAESDEIQNKARNAVRKQNYLSLQESIGKVKSQTDNYDSEGGMKQLKSIRENEDSFPKHTYENDNHNQKNHDVHDSDFFQYKDSENDDTGKADMKNDDEQSSYGIADHHVRDGEEYVKVDAQDNANMDAVIKNVLDEPSTNFEGDEGRQLKNTHRSENINENGKTSNYTYILDNRHVRNCITGNVLGTVPQGAKFENFKPHLKNTVQDNLEESFSTIYKEHRWGTNWEGTKMDNSSRSGRGANIHFTQELTATLHVIINQLKAILNKNRITLLDVPCGDMLWMSRFLDTRNDIDYTGVDIVPDLIAKHRKTFSGTSYTFMAADILKVGIQHPYDLILNRMMLQHLYHADAAKFLQIASDSGSEFLLTTTFPRHEINAELVIDNENPGRFRRLNLEVPPFSLVPPICIQRDGPSNDFDAVNHFIGLWKLPLRSVSLCRDPWAMYMKGSKQLYYSCVQWGHRKP